MLVCSHKPLVVTLLPPASAAQVSPPDAPDWAWRTYPLVGALDTLRFASSTILSAITVAPSAVEVTSPEWLGCT